MNDIAFADAARPARRVILNLLMADYSIGHELLLLQQRNPLVIMSEQEFNGLATSDKVSAISRAALACCQTWGKRNNPHRWLTYWRWKNRNTDYALAIADFQNYRHLGSTMPTLLEIEGPKKHLGIPHLARILNHVRDFDMPLGLAQWLYYSQAEVEGSVNVKTEHQSQVESAMDEMTAQILKEQKEKSCPD